MSTDGHKRKHRTIREEKSFSECVQRLGGPGYVDELIGHLKWRLSRDPISYSFQVSPRLRTRVAFTEELGDSVPVMRVFLTVEDDELVSLLWIEQVDDAAPFGFDDWLDLL
jgi:hypothetical protein